MLSVRYISATSNHVSRTQPADEDHHYAHSLKTQVTIWKKRIKESTSLRVAAFATNSLLATRFFVAKATNSRLEEKLLILV